MTRCQICGSHAINIDKAGLLCDVHFYKVQRDELLKACKLFVEYEKAGDLDDGIAMILAYEAARTAIYAAITKAGGTA